MRFDPERALVEIKREFGEHGGVCPSIERSSTFTVLEPGTMPEIFGGLRGPDKGGCFLYSRHFNPTVDVLARSLAAMEGTEYAVCTASGISAISCTLLQLCTHGDHIVASDTVYGGTHALLAETFPQMGIQTTLVDPTNVSAFEKAITPATKVLYTEVVGNPTLKVADIRALANLAHDRGIRLVVDNTFTPMVISPAQLGADVVVYSLTKFVNGASDMIAGAVCATKDFIFQLMDLHTGRVMLLGPTMDPRTAFDIYQRLPHLALRMREHSRRALAIAQRLESIGAPVVYPGLESHPQHALMRSMGNEGFGFGGLLTLDCGTVQRAEKTMSLLQNEEGFGYIAVSLGYFDTLISCSGSSTSSEIPPEDRERIGLSPGLLRIAVGYSGTLEDRMAQIERAVRKAELV
ncbi:MAG TPA: aminotransferase class I/II-fold pyridoxal phosphate-dependent enzyme [Polyangiaceae bacterium]|jgi:methionine-gamma-lyase|nr:MAG: Cystathionine gamma-lyase [Deltaproteobacteria bacterium ADurb.Bin207]HNS99315.1 aminotransferase class I/II-fold pyridoxal phosphate-dependent enzyme [Polyangiaceae bacterium]HNZ21995.1 aminotransferase class I/II-fold pyridoxal phosphate-dependent enzyme [Polyangiaceae bacterium]HOD25429.1 aminotransferase class I/II-fold pyridoxal phosphate-dependent enzyme [Polyangiaceae bacterium]HOE47303.1 aminotransferase class I/II-fold pyridoxal phosphate-dependent enzyme [Polyangiaceae bacteri